MSRSRPQTSGIALFVLAVAVASCDRDPGEVSLAGVDLRDAPLPCQVEGYPCTWNQVPDEILTRTKQLGDIAARVTLSTPSLDSVAAFLRDSKGVAEVVIDGTGVRFRLEGGRPAWVFLPSEMDHHRGGPPPASAARAVTHVHSGALSLAKRAAQAAGAWMGPPPLHAANQESREQAVVGEPGEGKRALLLSPFEHEFPGVGAELTNRVRVIRDYRDSAGGAVTFRADLDAYSDNPEAAGPEYRSIGGDPTLSGEVRFEDFLNWDTYNLVILATHGGNVSCRLPASVGGAERASEPRRGRPSPDLLPPPGVPGGCPLIYAGRAKQQSYGDYVGVEIHFRMGSVRQEEPPPASNTRYDTPGRREWRDGGPVMREELTPSEARACEAAAVEVLDPMTPDGRPCFATMWEHDNPMLALQWQFFTNEYPEGLNNTIVFLAACHSARGNVLLDALARPGNEAVTVFGFNTAVYATRAWAIVSFMIKLIDDGWDSEEAVRRVREFDEGLADDPDYQMPPSCGDGSCAPSITPDNVVWGRALDPHAEVLPDIPAELIDETPVATHGRDIVLLVKPHSGEELRDGGSVRVVGTPDDDLPDRLDLHPQILGIVDEADLQGVAMEVRILGEGIPEERYTPERQVNEGAYRFDRDIALGRDHVKGEVVDLEVSVGLPGGTQSRWVYENIRLQACPYFELTARGPLFGAAQTFDIDPELIRFSAFDDGSFVTIFTDGQKRNAVSEDGSVIEYFSGGTADGFYTAPGTYPLGQGSGWGLRIWAQAVNCPGNFSGCAGINMRTLSGTLQMDRFVLGGGLSRPHLEGPTVVEASFEVEALGNKPAENTPYRLEGRFCLEEEGVTMRRRSPD